MGFQAARDSGAKAQAGQAVSASASSSPRASRDAICGSWWR